MFLFIIIVNSTQSYNKDDKLIQNEEIVFVKHVRIGGSAYLAGKYYIQLIILKCKKYY